MTITAPVLIPLRRRVPRRNRVRARIVDVRAVPGHSPGHAWRRVDGRWDSAQLCAHVETSSSRSVPCATNSGFSLVPIDVFVHLTVCSGCACDVCGLAGGKRWCWSSQPRLPGGSAKGSVDAGAVARGGGRTERWVASPHIVTHCAGRAAWPRLVEDTGGPGAGRDNGRMVTLAEMIAEAFDEIPGTSGRDDLRVRRLGGLYPGLPDELHAHNTFGQLARFSVEQRWRRVPFQPKNLPGRTP